MEFVNQTRYAAQWTMAFGTDRREHLVVAIKASFDLPAEGGVAPESLEGVPLTKADRFTGAPGLSAPLYETDFAPFKQRCDILFVGRAYAPGDRRQQRVPVGIQVGAMIKQFMVTGPRRWQHGFLGARPGEPEPFAAVDLSYDLAFGGVDRASPADAQASFLAANPVGLGYAPGSERIDGMPMPQTEEIDRPIEDPSQDYRPMAFGPLGRNWWPRSAYCGTYDSDWMDERAPYWPDDFDARYFQSAPVDQQIDRPRGSVEVRLRNLTETGKADFILPTSPIPVLLEPHDGALASVEALADTIVIEPDQRRVCVTWRLSHPLQRHCFELRSVIVGGIAKVRDRRTSRGVIPHYRGLGELVRRRLSG